MLFIETLAASFAARFVLVIAPILGLRTRVDGKHLVSFHTIFDMEFDFPILATMYMTCFEDMQCEPLLVPKETLVNSNQLTLLTQVLLAFGSFAQLRCFVMVNTVLSFVTGCLLHDTSSLSSRLGIQCLYPFG